MMRLKLDEEKIIPEYLAYYLSSKKGKRRILPKIKKSVNQVSINQKDVKSIKIPLPSMEKQQEIVSKIEEKFETIENLENIKSQNVGNIRREIENFYS